MPPYLHIDSVLKDIYRENHSAKKMHIDIKLESEYAHYCCILLIIRVRSHL